MIRRIERHKRIMVYDKGLLKNGHFETHIVTTWYFLFMPIYTHSKLQSSNL